MTELHTLAGAHRQARLRRHDTLTTAVATTRSCPRSLTPPHRPRPRRCIDNLISIIIIIDLAATMGSQVDDVRPVARGDARRSSTPSRIWTRSSQRLSSPRERQRPRGSAAATRRSTRRPTEIARTYANITALIQDGPTAISSLRTTRSGI